MKDPKEQAGIAMSIRGTFCESTVDPKVTLAALAFADSLGTLLWHMKYGQDVTARVYGCAVDALSNSVCHRRWFDWQLLIGSDAPSIAMLARRFSERLIVEWVADRCDACGGRGVKFGHAPAMTAVARCEDCNGGGRVLELEEFIPFYCGRNGPRPVRHYRRCDPCLGRGVKSLRALESATDVCGHCAGSGRAPTDVAKRAAALGVTVEVCRRHWAGPFRQMLFELDVIDETVAKTVRLRCGR
ncbi:hypothetical protein [Paraburkholderia susongensis]|uniref:CR-type domain-containing protein n=1 Tax=Paraburkholderia susongensis TaxID=1515439 RepID=A0A1X7I6D6_9BURK|nr:hypothetical protein [Paraburkholderia susongensis]SMG09651.1 hypothetical protein SAMN06265784_101335 [Paraburkholderia susongensis]